MEYESDFAFRIVDSSGFRQIDKNGNLMEPLYGEEWEKAHEAWKKEYGFK
ncbi:MAG: hypothetical protein LBT41_02825 [Candidatus Methanoplasma sp.]|nr:hypothetical protein [Candidatus Methanoplasma sp.]